MLKRSAIIIAITLFAAFAANAQADTVMVLPFENRTQKAEFNWVGESFADSLSYLLNVPGLNVISNDERKFTQQKLRIPPTNLPSLATSLKLARESKATILVAGHYNILPEEKGASTRVAVSVKLIRVNEGRFMSEMFPVGPATPPLDLSDAIGNLQKIEGELAYKILVFHQKSSMAISLNEMISRANRVPARAFEAYIKGLLSPSTSISARENYFKNASKLYSETIQGGIYSEAELELGHFYLNLRRSGDSIRSFERVISGFSQCVEKAKAEGVAAQCSKETFAEASFYIGLLQWQQGNFESALATLRPLAEDLELTSVYNALGAIAVAASRSEKKDSAKAAALMMEGIGLLKKASESAPDDANIRFNYGATLFLSENYTEAAIQLRNAIAVSQRDGDAYYLLAKTLEILKDPLAGQMDNEARKYLTANNRYANLETEWKRTNTVVEINLRVQQPLRKDFVAVVLGRRQWTNTSSQQMTETESLLATARTQVKNGNDDDATATIRRVLASEPMSAESYLLLGKIHLRRGEFEQAISTFKTAIFWDNRLIEAYVSLVKIYVEKGDCLQAKTFAAQAIATDEKSEDVLGLQRMTERCSK